MMKKKLALRTIAIVWLGLFLFAIITIFITDYSLNSQGKDMVSKLSGIFSDKFVYSENADYMDFVKLNSETEVRITIIDKDGKVLADTIEDPNNMENHSNRKEFQNALEGNDKVVTRPSMTQGVKVMYLAKKVYNNDKSDFLILRVSCDAGSLVDYINYLVPTFIGVSIIMAILSIWLTNQVNKAMVSSVQMVGESLSAINDGTFKHKLPNFEEDELNKSFTAINEIQYKLNNHLQNVADERNKINHVVNSLDNGVILLNKALKIVLVNKAANRIYNITSDIIGKDIAYIPFNNDMLSAIQSVTNTAKKQEMENKINGNIYKISLNLVSQNIIILFTDVTAIKEYTDMKSEFFANASHELKTPITSIVGFTELYRHASTEEDKNKYIDRIEFHSLRMQNLVKDMMEVTMLEDKIIPGNVEKLDLFCLTKDIIVRLEQPIAQNNINVSIEGGCGLIGTRNSIELILENLISNAVKYNKINGQVSIAFIPISNGAKIEVSDTGIGIEKLHFDRIFERFYRVDKGRSKRTGGTGLGLSIVKHIANLYGGGVNIDSEINKGTKMTVVLYNLEKQ